MLIELDNRVIVNLAGLKILPQEIVKNVILSVQPAVELRIIVLPVVIQLSKQMTVIVPVYPDSGTMEMLPVKPVILFVKLV